MLAGMRGRLIPAVVTASALLAGCGAASEGSAPIETGVPATTSTTTTTATTPTTPVPPPATTTPPAGAPATAAPPADELSGFSTDPFRREHPSSVPPVPVLTSIRTARHEGYDRVVFDFDGPLPGAVAARYVNRVVADGSGNTVVLAGDAFLLVRFEGGQAHTDAGAPTVADRSRPGLPALTEIAVAGDYEGYVTIALGLTAKRPFRVLELSNPTRVVVDVANR